MHNRQAQNLLMTSIPPKNRQRLFANCEYIELALGDAINEPDALDHYVYFPTTAVISLVMPIDSHSKLDVGLIGNEGMLGIHYMLGIDTAPFAAVVHSAGRTERMSIPHFLYELENNAAFKVKLMRYLFVVMNQLIQASVCHRFHVVEERLARLLLMIKDRTHSTHFHITQESLSQMLGVRRVGVTKAAQTLQSQGFIKYSRGNVSIEDVQGLENASCNCYQLDKDVYERILNH